MTSIAKQIWHAIEEDIVVRSAIGKGIISLKGLAEYLIQKKKLDVSIDAAISAIRRYKEEQPLEKKFEHAKEMIKTSKDIRIISNIVCIALEKTKQTQDLLQKSFAEIDYDKGEILLIIQGEQSIKLMINDKNKQKILKFIPQKSILEIKENLAEVNIQLSKEAIKTPGILAIFSTELMMHNINVVETMSCLPEMLFFIEQKDVVKSYDILFNLTNK